MSPPIGFAEAAKKNGQGFGAYKHSRVRQRTSFPAFRLTTFVAVATIRTKARFKVSVDPLVDGGNHRTDLIGVREAHA